MKYHEGYQTKIHPVNKLTHKVFKDVTKIKFTKKAMSKVTDKTDKEVVFFTGQVHDERAGVVHVLQAALRQDGRPPPDAHEPCGPRRPPRRGLQRLQDAGRFAIYDFNS